MIKVIPTFYKGYHFRSRLEARWAVFFDAIGWRWEYEPEGFELPCGRRYLPDFEIKTGYVDCTGEIARVFVEVKADNPAPEELIKAVSLSSLRPTWTVAFAIGIPDIAKITALDAYEGGKAIDVSFSSYCFHKWGRLGVYMQDIGNNDEGDAYAVNAARSARFEFGQSGATR